MAKKLLLVWLSLTILIFSSASVFAEEEIRGDFFIKNIVINNERILNYQADNPFFVYKNLTYIPLNTEISKILGISWDMNLESRTLTIKKEDSTQKNFSQRWMKSNFKPVNCKFLSDISIVLVSKVKEETIVEDVSINSETINSEQPVAAQEAKPTIPEIAQENLDNVIEVGVEDLSKTTPGNMWVDPSKYSVLTCGDVIYVPIGMFAGNKEFGIDVFFDTFSGLYITTDGITTAESTFDLVESNLNKGLAKYIIRYNSNYNSAQALNLTFIFKQEARIYKMDPLLMMAVAHKESTFTAGAKSRSGALGMMQVMPKTGARYGLTEKELLNAQSSVSFGTLYLKERMEAYEGSVTKALSAYNQGSSAVNRGSYSPRYANAVMGKYNQIVYFLKANNYVTTD